MKLYTFSGAPNPRRVTLFAAEKGIDLALVEVDLRGGETRAPFSGENPAARSPCSSWKTALVWPRALPSAAILRHWSPSRSVWDHAPRNRANRSGPPPAGVGLFAHIGAAWVNGPIVAAAGLVKPIEAQRAREALAHQFYDRLEATLSGRLWPGALHRRRHLRPLPNRICLSPG